MARYNLIISDRTFKRMLDYGAKHNKTVGKLLNEVLNAYNWEETEGPPVSEKIEIQNPCAICGHESTVTGEHSASGRKKLFCKVCWQNALESHKWKELCSSP